MTEENTQTAATGAGADQNQQAQVGILAQYIKDLSFENPNAPASFQALQNAKPQIDVNVNVGARQAGENVYEVELKISASSTVEETATFVVELVYAGLFGLRNVPQEALQGFMLVNAPTLLFPFARRIIADATRDGGYPPLMLEPIDFAALYRQQLAQAQSQGGQDGTIQTDFTQEGPSVN